MNRAIDLNFVARRHKDLPLPKLVYTALAGSGIYYGPWNARVDLEERTVEVGAGLILVDPSVSYLQSTIAHEWRHHWQAYHWGMDPFWAARTFESSGDYWGAIARYFRIPIELDALRFEIAIHPDEVNTAWLAATNEKGNHDAIQ